MDKGPEGGEGTQTGTEPRATSSKYLGEPCLGRPASAPPHPAPPLTASEVVLHQASVPLVVTFPLVRLLLRGALGRGCKGKVNQSHSHQEKWGGFWLGREWARLPGKATDGYTGAPSATGPGSPASDLHGGEQWGGVVGDVV